MLSKSNIINYFKDIDNHLDDTVDICVLGGSVFVLMKIKTASPDIDFIVEGEAYNSILKIHNIIKGKYSFNLDILTDRWIGDVQLPDNYMKRAKRYRRFRSGFKHIRLWTLSLYDIIISKIYRWKYKDIEDINTIVSIYQIDDVKLRKRINKFNIPHKHNFEDNLKQFYKLFGSKLKNHLG